MIISAIAAISNNRVIGINNTLPWHVPGDLAFFKRTTLNHHIVMGRKTFKGTGRPLPKRTNIILTRDPFYVGTGIIVAHSIEEAIQVAEQNGEKELFICGGGVIYEASMHLWDKLYLTEIDTEIENGEAFFPEISEADWKLITKENFDKDERNEHAYTIKIYERNSAGASDT